MHVYCKHIKDRNIKGFRVKGVSFYELYEAEKYCSKLDLPPTKEYLRFDQSGAKHNAGDFERELKYVKGLLEDAREKERKKLDTLCAQYDCMKLLAVSVLDEGSLHVQEERIRESIGVLDGLDEAITIIRKRADEQWRLSRLNVEVEE